MTYYISPYLPLHYHTSERPHTKGHYPSRAGRLFSTYLASSWRLYSVYNTNYKGSWYNQQLPHMKELKRGRGFRGAYPGIQLAGMYVSRWREKFYSFPKIFIL